jgi:hypothetical protein
MEVPGAHGRIMDIPRLLLPLALADPHRRKQPEDARLVPFSIAAGAGSHVAFPDPPPGVLRSPEVFYSRRGFTPECQKPPFLRPR